MKDSTAKLYQQITDYCAIVAGWGMVVLFRWKMLYRLGYTFTKEWNGFRYLDSHFYAKWFLWVPLLAILLFAFMGDYAKVPYMKSRAKEIYQSIIQTFILAILLYFMTLLKEYTNYWHGLSVFIWLWFWLFICVCLGRVLLLQYFKQQILTDRIHIPFLIIGSKELGEQILQEFEKNGHRQGYKCVGNIPLDESTIIKEKGLKQASNVIFDRIKKQQVRLLIFAFDKPIAPHIILRYIAELSTTNIDILRLPEELDYFSGNIKTEDILSVPLVSVNPDHMPIWQQHTKRIFDITLSIFGLSLGSPLFLWTAIRTHYSSPGSMIYKQIRIGRNGHPFQILKFRSMYVDAEKNGPLLSSDGDERITAWGKTMRKWRLDELPQLWNILKGDMSFVGPRPERDYFIEQLSEHIPYYKYLLKVRPGLTSWGMVKYGYASNLGQMKERLKYDLIYLDNASLLVDIKILIYTVRILFLGKGK